MNNKERVLDRASNTPTQNCASLYVGRFAPSPSGPLHFGSLVCALASFLHAKQHHGKWLVRIEDVDTPRIEAGMVDSILTSLIAHGLIWDDKVTFQSKRSSHYQEYLDKLQKAQLLYGCACTRQQIRARSKTYDGYCRKLGLSYENRAIRFVHTNDNSKFIDLRSGPCFIEHEIAKEDPVLKRADGIYAYHLAVVADDIEQKVTHIVRGIDLLETTPVHLSLYQAFNESIPEYLHIPVLAQKPNEKLSKQNHAPAINNEDAIGNIKLALQYLGISDQIIPKNFNIEQILDWAIANWSYKLLSKQSELLISVTNGVYSTSKSMMAAGNEL